MVLPTSGKRHRAKIFLYTKEGDNIDVTKKAVIAGIILDATSPVGSKWYRSVMAEIQRVRSVDVSIGGSNSAGDGSGDGDGVKSNLVGYYATLAAHIFEDTDTAVGNGGPKPEYNK